MKELDLPSTPGESHPSDRPKSGRLAFQNTFLQGRVILTAKLLFEQISQSKGKYVTLKWKTKDCEVFKNKGGAESPRVGII